MWDHGLLPVDNKRHNKRARTPCTGCCATFGRRGWKLPNCHKQCRFLGSHLCSVFFCVAFVLLSLMCVLACCFVVSRVLLCVLCCCVVSCCLVCVCVCVCFLCFALFKPVGRDMFSFFARVGLSERAHRAISR